MCLLMRLVRLHGETGETGETDEVGKAGELMECRYTVNTLTELLFCQYRWL